MSIFLVVAMAVSYDCPRIVGFDPFGKSPAIVRRVFCRESTEREVRPFLDKASAMASIRQGEKLYQLVAERGRVWKREVPVDWIPREGK